MFMWISFLWCLSCACVCVHWNNLWCFFIFFLFFVYLPTGLNGRPICMVQDDWNVTTSLFPHPLLKSHTVRGTSRLPFSFPLVPNLCGPSNNKCKSSTFVKCSISPSMIFSNNCVWILWVNCGLRSISPYLNFTAVFSEAWKEALKELAAKVRLAAQEQKEVQFLQPSGLRVCKSQPLISFSCNCIMQFIKTAN